MTGSEIYLDPGVLAVPTRVEIICPECGRVHIWDPVRHTLTEPEDPPSA